MKCERDVAREEGRSAPRTVGNCKYANVRDIGCPSSFELWCQCIRESSIAISKAQISRKSDLEYERIEKRINIKCSQESWSSFIELDILAVHNEDGDFGAVFGNVKLLF